STVARALARRGAIVIDADAIAREVVEPGQPSLAAVVERFGPEVLDDEGRLDRPQLAALVFDDAAARADLNAIVHPRVAAETGRGPAGGDRLAQPGAGGGGAVPDAARHHRVGQVVHHRRGDRPGPAAHDRPRPQQEPGRPADQRVPGVLPQEPGRVLRLLLRLL